ncbi:hypothetical protein BT96DRAFT_505953 [Gymnopus androsaceus JB14]|uniref:Uncharacterized protein n=1 Tax=Gymnopus androsaceus JB14 TaxID=1447944 RepID=A0A6A4HYR5_9AGAR|nr:hypothetical protein BT96DRAFT_505953 [Gymnopus androsaceus JB14]
MTTLSATSDLTGTFPRVRARVPLFYSFAQPEPAYDYPVMDPTNIERNGSPAPLCSDWHVSLRELDRRQCMGTEKSQRKLPAFCTTIPNIWLFTTSVPTLGVL